MWYRVLKIDIARGFPCKLAYQSKTICASHSSIQEHDTTREISMGGFSAPEVVCSPYVASPPDIIISWESSLHTAGFECAVGTATRTFQGDKSDYISATWQVFHAAEGID